LKWALDILLTYLDELFSVFSLGVKQPSDEAKNRGLMLCCIVFTETEAHVA